MALTIRERFDNGRGVGTIGTRNRPLPLEVNLEASEPTSQIFQVRLGYDGIPSTQFWELDLPQHCSIRCLRRSRLSPAMPNDLNPGAPRAPYGTPEVVGRVSPGISGPPGGDPYITHVAINLSGPDGERSGRPLVQTVDGDSGWIAIDRGRWLISAAVGIAIEIEFELEILLAPTPRYAAAIVTPQLKAPPRITTNGRIWWSDIDGAVPAERPAVHRPGPRFRLRFPPAAIDSSAIAGAPRIQMPLQHPGAEPSATNHHHPAGIDTTTKPGSLAIQRAHGSVISVQAAKHGPTAAGASLREHRGEQPLHLLQATGLVPPDWDFWALRPWRGGIANGALWLQDRRGLLHTFSPEGVFIAPAPGRLTGATALLRIEGLQDGIELRSDAAADGILQGPAYIKHEDGDPGPTSFKVEWAGSLILRGLWHRLAGHPTNSRELCPEN
ncbi:MAG: hypothetical protein WBM08_03615 [Prochlorococcaceae cyanobacterium]